MGNVFIATPTTRDFPGTYIKSIWTTEIKGRVAWDYVEGQAIDIGRNSVVKKFLKLKDYDYLLMHDSDATWHPGAIQRLIERDLPVVTAVIFKRGLPTLPTIGKHVSISPEGAHLYSFADTINRILEVVKREKLDPDCRNIQLFDKHSDDIQEIDGAGAHFMLIRRDVLEAMSEPYYQCSRVNSGEDFYFCRKVQEAGFKQYVDYSVYTGHHVGGGIEFGIREFMLYSDKAKLDTVWTI